MECLACQHRNRDEARFCEACGAALPARCESCGNELRDGAGFCDACGRPREQEPATPAAERRQLTVMFCDLVGSTQLSQQLDAEDLREVVGAYHHAASRTVEAHGGHVAQYLGDGLLAYFGYPQADEYDGEHAVRAGLEVLERLEAGNDALERAHGVRLQARIGIHTGPVVIGEVGGGARRERLALGDTTNIASRLEGAAEPGSVFISDATLRLVGGLFVTRDRGNPILKGVTSSIHAFQVVQASGMRSRTEAYADATPLVGRQMQMGILLDRWEKATTGSGQFALVSAKAGFGKSRLLQELRERVGGTSHTWLEMGCSRYTEASVLKPVAGLLEHGLRFEASDTTADRLARLERGLDLVGLDRSATLPLVAELLELPVPDGYAPIPAAPERVRQRTLHALVDWTLALARLQPLILVCEDLQWSDPSTLDLLSLLLDRGRDARLLVVLTYRPGFEPPWEKSSRVTALSLGPLAPPIAREMVVNATREAGLSDTLIDRIVERADGVPLFAEELARMVVESGVKAEDEIPTTLQGSLMARLDRLGAAKEVAQRAAVLGREFSHSLIGGISLEDEETLCSHLARVVDAGLLFQRGAPPDAAYSFKHAMLLDVAYQSLLRRTRQQLHLRTADVLEAQLGARPGADHSLVAHHLDRGGDAVRAVAAYQRAARHAGERSANAEAEQQLRRAVELVAELPEGEARDRAELPLQNLLGIISMRLRGYADETALPAFERGVILARELDDDDARAVALVGLSAHYQNRVQHERAIAHAEEIVALAEQTRDPLHALSGHGLISPPAFYAGELERALSESRSALRHHGASSAGVFTSINDFGVAAHGFGAWSATILGHLDEGLDSARAGVALAEKLEHAFSIALAYVFHAATHVLRGEPAPARAWALRAIDLAEELHFPLWRGLGLAFRGWADLQDGDEAALAAVQEGLGVAGSTGSQAGAPFLLAVLGEANLRCGDLEAARGALDGALAAGTQQPFANPLLHTLIGDTEAARGSRKEAEARYRSALDDARARSLRLFEVRAACRLARLELGTSVRRGDGSAGSLLAEVCAWFGDDVEAPDLAEARALLDELG